MLANLGLGALEAELRLVEADHPLRPHAQAQRDLGLGRDHEDEDDVAHHEHEALLPSHRVARAVTQGCRLDPIGLQAWSWAAAGSGLQACQPPEVSAFLETFITAPATSEPLSVLLILSCFSSLVVLRALENMHSICMCMHMHMHTCMSRSR